jgi:hypothetical protein
MTAMARRAGRDGWLFLGLVGLLALAGGVLSASGRVALVAIFVGLVLAVLVASSRVAVFWLVVVIALVATGLAQLYIPGTGARYVRYVAPVASLALLLHWVNDQLMAHPRDRTDLLPTPVVWGMAFAATGVASWLINLSTLDVAFMGARNYFQMGAFFLGVALLRWDHRKLDRSLLRALVLIALLQVPFAFHQYFYLVPRRLGLGDGIVPVDIVAGTFGATLYGGGANAVLAAFQIIVVGLLLALWKNGATSLLRTALLSAVILSPLLVNQAKIAVLYLPLVFLVLFRRDFIVRPGKFLVAGVGVAGVFAVLMTALVLSHPSGRLQSWGELVDFVVARQTASIAERGYDEYNALSRWTALTFWAEKHATANPIHTLIGHGLGASREQDATDDVHTLAEQKYPGLNIGYTALSALLWDTGVVGLVTVLGMLASAFFMAGSLARQYRNRDPWRCALYEGLQAALAVLTLGLAHKDFFIVNIPYQTLTYLCVGYIASAWLATRREGRRRVPWGI